MSHEPKPSEHAMRAANLLHEWEYLALDTKAHEIAPAIDQHAIAPAVAERDRRIAELETHLKLTVNQLKHTQHMAKNGYGPSMLTPDIILFSEQILAKSERSAP